MRKPRTIYFNDARHYYLFVHEPPISLEDAWAPVDEIVGTGVDTFCYGVERGDGLFYPSIHGGQFGADIQPFEQAAYWRSWHNMQSLAERGLDPLRLLIDRSHEKGLDFIVSLRMGGYGGMDPPLKVANGGGGLAEATVREHQMKVVLELVENYPIEGLELDLAMPGGSPLIRPGDGDKTREELTTYVTRISDVAREKSIELGVRVIPTETMNLSEGMDILTWMSEGLLDFVVPVRYGYMILDPDLPVRWLVDSAHAADTSVYGMLQPYSDDASTGAPAPVHATAAHLRAAADNYRQMGVDGLYTWFLPWPMSDPERQILTEMASPDLSKDRDKQYIVARNVEKDSAAHYPVPLPLEIQPDETGQTRRIPFMFSENVAASRPEGVCVSLRLNITDLVEADKITLRLNGKSLENETCTRNYGHWNAPYIGQWLTLHLETVKPVVGENVLELILDSRPPDLASPIRLNDVEIEVRYGDQDLAKIG